jgi:hypothetical protein
VTLGNDLHGIRLESHTEASDFSSTTASLLVPWQEDVVRAFTGETAYSNRNVCGPDSSLRDPCYAWQRADTFTAVPGQDYDDLVLTGNGTQPPPETDTAKPAKTTRVHGKQKPEPPPAPTAIPYTSVERLRFRDGRYLPVPDTDTTIPAH